MFKKPPKEIWFTPKKILVMSNMFLMSADENKKDDLNTDEKKKDVLNTDEKKKDVLNDINDIINDK
jgi:hypothetical protein